MKKFLLACTLFSTIVYATVFSIEVEGCQIKFNTFTKEWNFSKNCSYPKINAEGKENQLVQLKCEFIDEFVMKRKERGITLYYNTTKRMYDFLGITRMSLGEYTANDFAIDLNSGVFERCTLIREMTIKSNDK